MARGLYVLKVMLKFKIANIKKHNENQSQKFISSPIASDYFHNFRRKSREQKLDSVTFSTKNIVNCE